MERTPSHPTFLDGAAADLGGPRTMAFLDKCERLIPSDELAGSGWLMLMETIESDTSSPPDGTLDATRVKKYTWGRDLSGMYVASCGTGTGPLDCLAGAGGIGGLLSVFDDNATSSTSDDLNYVYFCDANGNVSQVIDLAASSASASIKAHYEYDAYGNVTASSGTYATVNTFRFSTKYWDDETGLGYWGERYYDPRLGRWINHDPIGELGGLNLYAYVRNRPVITIDPIGRQSAISDDAWEGLDEWIFGPIINGTSSAACWTCANAAGANVLLQLRLEGIDGTDDFGGGNAFRHCLATCQTAKACGMSCAKWFWDGRETPGVPADDQDLANNQVGYGCASQDSCWSCCMNAWHNGGLTCRVADPNDPQKRGPCPPRPPPPPPPPPPPKEPAPGPGRRCDM